MAHGAAAEAAVNSVGEDPETVRSRLLQKCAAWMVVTNSSWKQRVTRAARGMMGARI